MLTEKRYSCQKCGASFAGAHNRRQFELCNPCNRRKTTLDKFHADQLARGRYDPKECENCGDGFSLLNRRINMELCLPCSKLKSLADAFAERYRARAVGKVKAI